jgi:ligand-binding sensor domain-containing protein/signal transduction histidine kinase/DNA-binding response OmpR family regulator
MKKVLFLFSIAIMLSGPVHSADPYTKKIITDLLFTRFTSMDGLPDNRIRTVFQDSRGFLWVGTMNGVGRYDGYSFKKFYSTNDPNSISGNWAFAICEDAQHDIWIGTLNGLNVIHTKTGKVTSLKNIPGNNHSLFSNKITSLQFDRAGMLWIGTQNGLARLNPATGIFDTPGQYPLRTYISKIIRSDGDYLWIAAAGGMVRYNSRTGASRFYPIKVEPDPYGTCFWSILEQGRDLYIATATQGMRVLHYNDISGDYELIDTLSDTERQLQHTEVFDICRSASGDLWLATDRGIAKISAADKKVSFFTNNPLNDQSLSNNTVYTVFIDRTDNLWAGTELGLNKLNLHTLPFHYYTFRDPGSLGQVRSIFTANGSDIWIGTARNACYKYNLTDNSTKTYQLQPAISPFNAHRALYIDSTNAVWLGTLGGAVTLDQSVPTASKKQLEGPAVFAFLKDTKGNLWIGTNNGLLQIKQDGTRMHYKHDPADPQSLSASFVRSLYEDSNGNIWIGFETCGVSYLNTSTGRFTRVKEGRAGEKVLGNIIYSIVESPKGVIWAGSESGLNRITFKGGADGRYQVRIRNYLEQDGLPDKSVNGILAANDGALWISTIKGLLRFDIASERFRHFLPTVNFSFSCAYKYNDHQFLFGSSDGFVVFDPQQVSMNTALPEVVFSDFRLFNKEVGINQAFNGSVILQQSITDTKDIALGYKNNVFTIGFLGLHFSSPENNAYAYMMEGFDKDWIYASAADRAVTYTNLDPGTYTFKVKAANSSGEWNNQPATLRITIFPPPWETWWAILSYVIVAAGGLTLLIQQLIKQSRQKHALETERLLRLKEEQFYKEQLSFFTNIAHELQTPLTLINGSIERYLYKSSPEQPNANGRFLSIVHQQSSRLTYLVNQLLDFRKGQAGYLKACDSELGVSALFTGIAQLFEPLSEQKELSFAVEIQPGITVLTDKDKLEKIVFNLLSNAFKHTPRSSNVLFTLQYNNGCLEFEVANSGCTLSQEQLQQLFNKFFVADETTHDKYSHGLGLAFTQQLVELLGGSIRVINESDRISFKVSLPAAASCDSSEDNTTQHAFPSYLLRSITAGGEPAMQQPAKANNKRAVFEQLDNTEKKSILVVDDEPSIRFLLQDIFAEQYIVYEAENGRQALELIQSHPPDLIVSDIMMPEIGGLELCNRVKNTPACCHIPVVLLSAKGSLEQKTEGYDAGADAYIPKPFDIQHLQVRVKRLLQYRQRLLELFKKDDFKAGLAEEELEATDKKFLSDIVKMIEENIDETELDSAFLEERMMISKTQLYRKLKALSGMAPGDFIKHVRLQKACSLLKATQLTIAEIFYKTGFNNRSYFFREFKKMYNCSPKEYREQYRIQI